MSTPPTPQDSPFCRTCAEPLDLFVPDNGQAPRHFHSGTDPNAKSDHVPDPVPLSQHPTAHGRCDFCAARSAWSYICREAQVTHQRAVTRRYVSSVDARKQHYAARTLRADTVATGSRNWGQHWAACNACAELIEARDLMGLVRRGVDSTPPKWINSTKKLLLRRGELIDSFSATLETLEPGRFRITPEHPLGVWEPAEDNGGTSG